MFFIRQREKALKYGNYKHIYLEYRRPFIFERSCENERIYVAVNIADHDEFINLGSCNNGGFWDLLTEECITNPHSIRMKPHSARILKEGR